MQTSGSVWGEALMKRAIETQANYEVVRKIADGGMGAVYEAIQHGAHGFQKRVALKTLLPRLSDRPGFVEMFIHEAKLVASLVHENIVQIYQLGRTDEGYFLVMEYVNGLPLRHFIDLHRSLDKSVPQQLAVFIVSRIARALAYAHSRVDEEGGLLAIVHRDVCPSNILITTEGLPKLTDFGIALVSGPLAEQTSGRLLGKLPYVAPEQAAVEEVDARADIFSLGAVLFELLSGRRIRSNRDRDTLRSMARRGDVAWHRLPDEVPEELIDILQACLAPFPEDRYGTSKQLARRLEYYIYRDGYGPTIQTLEDYLRAHFPDLYEADGVVERVKVSPEPISSLTTDPDITVMER